MRGFDAHSLDGTAKGDGGTDDDAKETWAWGRGAGIVVVFVREKKSAINEESWD